jgi:flagellar biosynthesis protein
MNGRNKTEKAVAILYDQQKAPAPKIVASGQGLIARKIIETAREAGIFIKEDPDLLELLAKIPVGEEIPQELYQTVAEVLAFVYSVNEKFKKKLEAS